MSALDRLGEKRLKMLDRTKAQDFLDKPENRSFYEELRAQINVALSQTVYFHGGGRFQYPKLNNFNYAKEPADTLPKLVRDGLKPREDLFAEKMTGQDVPTLSVTHLRQYARLYASMFLHKEDHFLYEYGPRRFWWMLLGAKMGCGAALNNPGKLFTTATKWFIKTPEEREQSKNFRHQAQLWPRKFDSSFVADKNSLHFLNDVMAHAQSDIIDNMPLIFGIKTNGLNSLPLSSRTCSMFEQRTTDIVSPQNWSYIETGLSYVEKLRNELRNLGLDIPVFPTEIVELCMRDKNITELTKPQKI
jgi:hypothetical protein